MDGWQMFWSLVLLLPGLLFVMALAFAMFEDVWDFLTGFKYRREEKAWAERMRRKMQGERIARKEAEAFGPAENLLSDEDRKVWEEHRRRFG